MPGIDYLLFSSCTTLSYCKQSDMLYTRLICMRAMPTEEWQALAVGLPGAAIVNTIWVDAATEQSGDAGEDGASAAAPAAEPSMAGLIRPTQAREGPALRAPGSDMHHPILGIPPAAVQTLTEPVSGGLSSSCKT